MSPLHSTLVIAIAATLWTATLLQAVGQEAVQRHPPGDGQPAGAAAASIAELVEQLDSERFQERQLAEQQLMRLGKQAIAEIESALEAAEGEAKIRLRRIVGDLRRSIRLVETHQHPSLDFVTSATVSDDGRFLYTAAWKACAVSQFSVDPKTGRLVLAESIQDVNDWKGAVAIRLSADNRLAAVPSFSSKTVTLLVRDQDTGKLKRKHTVKPNPAAPSLAFPIEAAFSPDSKLLYVLDTSFRGAKTIGAIFVYRVSDQDELEFVETNVGQKGCFQNARGIAFHPSLDRFYVAAADPGQLAVVDFDRQTGQTAVQQIVADEKDGVHGLSGVMSVAVSADGKFLYSSSGRFRGDSAISVFKIAEDGGLSVIDEHISGRDRIGNFLGGNELLVSLDGKNVYATGTRSATLAGFSRDAETGRLQFIETVSLGGQELGPAGLAIGADGDYLYVAVEGSGGIAVFRRD